MNRFVYAAVFTALAFAAFMLPAMADEMVMMDGTPNKGTVKVDDYEWVRMVAPGRGEIHCPQDKVKKIVYTMTPAAFNNAEIAYSQGYYDRAADAYLEALEQRHNKLLKQYILYGLGKSYAAAGDVENSLATLQKLLDEVPRTKFLFEVIDTKIRLHIQREEWNKAKALIPRLKTVDPDRAMYLDAFILEKQKNYRGASKQYTKVAQNTDGVNDEIYAQSRAGQMRCAFHLKKFDDFHKLVRETMERPEEATPELMANLYYHSGYINMEHARSNPDRYDDVLDNFVRVFVLYDSPSTKEFSAEACYRAGELCELISTRNHPELKPESKRLFIYCARTFKDSEWAKKALAKAR